MSDFFDKSLEELLSTSTVENKPKIDTIKAKIFEDFEELRHADGVIYPSPVKPPWKN